MAKLYKAGKDTDSCKVSIHPFYLNELKWKPGDELVYVVRGKKLIVTKKED